MVVEIVATVLSWTGVATPVVRADASLVSSPRAALDVIQAPVRPQCFQPGSCPSALLLSQEASFYCLSCVLFGLLSLIPPALLLVLSYQVFVLFCLLL